MGEYANYKGEHIKIGTCEDMYYLRADQRHLIEGYKFSDEMLAACRFRFPFPDEDHIEPGQFDVYDRGVSLYGVDIPDEVTHYKVQFVARVGFNVMLPCPLSKEGKESGLKMHANGFAGPVKIVQQALRNGVWVTICRCGACDTTYRLPTMAEAEPVIVALRSSADHYEREGDAHRAKWYHTIADRITAGYEQD